MNGKVCTECSDGLEHGTTSSHPKPVMMSSDSANITCLRIRNAFLVRNECKS
jgi:hypothetical protein